MDYISLALAAVLSFIFSFLRFQKNINLIIISIFFSILVFIINIFLYTLPIALLYTGLSIILFGVLFFTGLLSKKTTFLIPAVVAAVPLHLWWAFAIVLILNGFVSIYKIIKTTGIKDVTATATSAYVHTKYGKVEDVREMAENPNIKTSVNFFRWTSLSIVIYIAIVYIVSLIF